MTNLAKIIDIETNRAATVIWMVAVSDIGSGKVEWATNREELKKLIEGCDIFIGHNLLSFDVPILNKLWKMEISLTNCIDTLVMSRLWNPALEGGHSLENWGRILRSPKGNFVDFDNGLTEKMIEYCVQDVKLTEKVYNYLYEQFQKDKFSMESLEIEHLYRIALDKQEKHGFKFDVDEARSLLRDWETIATILKSEVEHYYEPTVVQLKTKTKIVPFNPASRQQVADRLIKRGWKPALWTDPGNPKKKLSTANKKPKSQPVVNDEILEELKKTMPEVGTLANLFTLNKRIAQLRKWLELVDENGFVHGSVISCGAISGRCTHSNPNMAQVPAIDKPYGEQCRSLWIPSSPDRVLVGIDASGLELRMLAHYMGDASYIETVVSGKQEDGTDVHTRNQKMAGLSTRSQAKTFIYAFLYGAGAEKIGSIVGGGAAEGKRLLDKFLKAMPALAKLRDKVAKIAESGMIPALDGRKLRIRHSHAALNQLLQGGGSIVMKKARILFEDSLTDLGIDATIVADVHDEWQVDCSEEDAEMVGELGVASIAAAGEHFKMKCPLTGEYKIGKSWKDTH